MCFCNLGWKGQEFQFLACLTEQLLMEFCLPWHYTACHFPKEFPGSTCDVSSEPLVFVEVSLACLKLSKNGGLQVADFSPSILVRWFIGEYRGNKEW